MWTSRSRLFEVVRKDRQRVDVIARGDLLQELKLSGAARSVRLCSVKSKNLRSVVLARICLAVPGRSSVICTVSCWPEDKTRVLCLVIRDQPRCRVDSRA